MMQTEPLSQLDPATAAEIGTWIAIASPSDQEIATVFAAALRDARRQPAEEVVDAAA